MIDIFKKVLAVILGLVLAIGLTPIITVLFLLDSIHGINVEDYSYNDYI